MPLEQLQQIRKSLAEEVQYVTNQFANLQVARQRYFQSQEALNDLNSGNMGSLFILSAYLAVLVMSCLFIDANIMIPLTTSLYIPGKLKNVESVLVDIGTGYFLEKPIDMAKKWVDGKSEMLQACVSRFC